MADPINTTSPTVNVNPGASVKYDPNNPFNVGVAGTGNFGGVSMPTAPNPNYAPRYASGFPAPSASATGTPGAQASTPPTALEAAEQQYQQNSQVEDPAAITKRISDMYQQEIMGIKQTYADKISAQQVANEDLSGKTRASEAAAGVIGSDFGLGQTAKTNEFNQQQLDTLNDEEQSAIASIYSTIASTSESEYQTELTNRTAAEKDYITYLTNQATAAQQQIQTLASTMSLDQIDQPTYDYLFKASGFGTPQQFNDFFNAAYLAAHNPTTVMTGTAASGYNLITYDKQGNVTNQKQVIAPVAPKPVNLAPGSTLVDPKTGKTIASGAPKIQVVPFLSSVVSTGGGTGTGTKTSQNTQSAGNASLGGATVKDDTGNQYGLTKNEVSALKSAKVPEPVWGKVAGILTGNQPPPAATGFSANSPAAVAISDGLQALGFNLAQYTLEWNAAVKQVQALNSPQMDRFRGLAGSVVNTIGNVRDLANKMDLSGITPLNNAELQTLINTAGNTEDGKLAAQYMAAVNTLKEEFANLANGGYAPTEAAWGLANSQINGTYGVDELQASLDEVQRLINYRMTAMLSVSPIIPGQQGGTASPTDSSSGNLSGDQIASMKQNPAQYGGQAGDILVRDQTGNLGWVSQDDLTQNPGLYTQL